MPIESLVTTLIDWTFVLMTRTKLAFVGFVAARNCTLSVYLPVAGRSPQQHAPLSTHQTVPECPCTILRTTKYCIELLRITKYYSSTTPVLLRTTKYYSSTTLYYKVQLLYYSELQSTTKVLLQYHSVYYKEFMMVWYCFRQTAVFLNHFLLLRTVSF